MSFELVVISDQLRTFIAYNYADVNVEEGIMDAYGNIIPSKLG